MKGERDQQKLSCEASDLAAAKRCGVLSGRGNILRFLLQSASSLTCLSARCLERRRGMSDKQRPPCVSGVTLQSPYVLVFHEYEEVRSA